MNKILVPVDGSEYVTAALRRAIPGWTARLAVPVEVHLVNVQRPVGQDVGKFVGHRTLADYHREEGLKALAPLRDGLVADGVPVHIHVMLGESPAATICEFVREHQIAEILMTTHGRGSLASLLMGSVASEVVRQTSVPVTLVK